MGLSAATAAADSKNKQGIRRLNTLHSLRIKVAKVSEAVANIGIHREYRCYLSQIPPPVLTGSGSTGLLSANLPFSAI